MLPRMPPKRYGKVWMESKPGDWQRQPRSRNSTLLAGHQQDRWPVLRLGRYTLCDVFSLRLAHSLPSDGRILAANAAVRGHSRAPGLSTLIGRCRAIAV